MLETGFPHVNMLGFVSHNFKRPSYEQDKDFWDQGCLSVSWHLPCCQDLSDIGPSSLWVLGLLAVQ